MSGTMTGPEHYREAERLLAEADRVKRSISVHHPNPKRRTAKAAAPYINELLLRAQIHASLAAAPAEAPR